MTNGVRHRSKGDIVGEFSSRIDQCNCLEIKINNSAQRLRTQYQTSPGTRLSFLRHAFLIFMLLMFPLHSTGYCINYLCKESSGLAAVYRTDSTPGCANVADNYLTSKCGVGYTGMSCIVDCSGIYSWLGTYWGTVGCNFLGDPCGSGGECPALVLDSCKNASIVTSDTSPTSTTSASQSSLTLPSNSGSLGPTSTSLSPSASPSDSGVLSQLLHCQPCGTSKCTFTPEGNLSSMIFDLIVGSPVYNCDPHATTPNMDTITGKISLSDAWSLSSSIGISFGELGVTSESSSSWTRTATTEQSQSIEITILPGQIGALVAHVSYKRTKGTINIGSGQGFPLISNQPFSVIGYDSTFVSCGSTFSANVSSTFNCTSSARSWQGESMFSVIGRILMILVTAVLVGLVI